MNLDAMIVEALASDSAFANCELECFTPDVAVTNGDGADGFAVVPTVVSENQAEGYGGHRARVEHEGTLGLAVRSASLARLQAMVAAVRTYMDTIRASGGVLRADLVGVAYSTNQDGSAEFLAVATYNVSTHRDMPITGP